MNNVKDLRISAILKEIDQLKAAIFEIQDNIRKLSANDEHTVRVFALIQEKHNGLKDVVMKTLVKVTHLENDIKKIDDEDEVQKLLPASSETEKPKAIAPAPTPIRPRDRFKKPDPENK